MVVGFGIFVWLGIQIIFFLGMIAYNLPLQSSIIVASILFLWISYRFFGTKVRDVMQGIGLLIAIIFFVIACIVSVFAMLGLFAELLRAIADNIITIAIVIVLIVLAYFKWGKA